MTSVQFLITGTNRASLHGTCDNLFPDLVGECGKFNISRRKDAEKICALIATTGFYPRQLKIS